MLNLDEKEKKMEELIDIKENNYMSIYQLFFQYATLSKPQIVKLLQLSLPTVTHNITRLEQEGKIQENGLFKPQGGRPAIAYSLVKDASISIGVEIQHKKMRCLALNLKGEIIHKETFAVPFSNSLDYIQQLCQHINTFIQQLGYQDERILGIGFSIQGIADRSGDFMQYARVIVSDYFTTEILQPYFKPQVKLFHDVKCAALTELWYSPKIENAIYISISEHLGGAIISNNQIELGKKGYAGALEHLPIHSDGKLCYCGQKGCLERYCSLSALLDDEDIVQFFERLHNGVQTIEKRWDNFLNDLAKGLNTVYLLLEKDIILGGEIAYYLREKDLKQLQQKISDLCAFNVDEPILFIAQQRKYSSAIGAALPFLPLFSKP